MAVARAEEFRVDLGHLACSAVPAVMSFAAVEDRNAKRLCTVGDVADGAGVGLMYDVIGGGH
jgi:hypothetical protein